MKKSIITDEASQNLREALAFARDFQLDGVELRLIDGKDPFQWTDGDVREMRRALSGEGFPVCCLSLPFLKCEADDEAAISEHIEALKRCLGYANELSCGLVRGFNFWRHGDALPLAQIAAAYARAVPLLEDADVTLAMETEPSTNAASADRLNRTLDVIGSNRVRALYDGGNLIFSEIAERPLAAYELLKPRIAHVHVKDAVGPAERARAVKIGTGEAQTRETLEQMKKDGYVGWVSLETHYRLSRALDDETLKRPAGTAFSDGGWDASFESMRALNAMLG